MCARVHYCWYNMLYVISAQPPVYVKGDNKRHMNSNKAQPQSINSSSSQSQHCNLKPLFESCVSVLLCVCVCAHIHARVYVFEEIVISFSRASFAKWG